MAKARIAVIGSINMDIVNQVERHPQPGETIYGLGTSYSPGGKGANQAVAAARAGADVLMVGAVGTDAFGDVLVSSLEDYGISGTTLLHKEGTSGLAFITVNVEVENHIILSSGANAKLVPDDIEAKWPQIDKCSAILLQNEIPWDTTRWVINRASSSGIRVYFNPAPAIRVPEELLSSLYCLILNETEAELLTGLPVGDPLQEEGAVQMLMETGLHSVVLTLGSRGSLFGSESEGLVRTEAVRVKPLDTTAAGDTFIGSFSTACEEGQAVRSALKFASAAAALTVTKPGAQQSVPSREETEVFLRNCGTI